MSEEGGLDATLHSSGFHQSPGFVPDTSPNPVYGEEIGRQTAMRSMTKRGADHLSVGLSTIIFISLLLGPSHPALAATLNVNPSQGPSPATVTADGAMFDGIGEVSFYLNGEFAGTATPDAAGAVTIVLTVVGSPDDEIAITACQSDSSGEPCGVTARALFTIITSPTTTVPESTLPPSTTVPPTSAPTTTIRPATTTTRPLTATIATPPLITLPPVTFSPTTIGGLIVPGPDDGGQDDTPGPRPSMGTWLGWLLLLVGAGLLSRWRVRAKTRLESNDQPRNLPDDQPEKLNLGGNPRGSGYDDSAGEVTFGDSTRESQPSSDEAGKKKGNIETTWKVEEGESGVPAPDDEVLNSPTDPPDEAPEA